jgi:hypothetical protein
MEFSRTLTVKKQILFLGYKNGRERKRKKIVVVQRIDSRRLATLLALGVRTVSSFGKRISDVFVPK